MTGARVPSDAIDLGALPLSYSGLLPKPESNRRPPRYKRSNPILTASKVVVAAGFEPALAALSTPCLFRLGYATKKGCLRRDLHPHCPKFEFGASARWATQA